MSASKHKIFLSMLGLMLAGIAACGSAEREREISAAPNSAAASANQIVVTPPPPESATKTLPSEAVKVRDAEIKIRAGDAAEAAIEIVVAEGYHINVNAASSKYLRPTRLKIERAANIAVGAFDFPAGKLKKFDFADESIAVYENTIVVKLSVRVSKGAKAGQTVLRGSAQAQPCNDNACFPSRTVEFSLLVQIVN